MGIGNDDGTHELYLASVFLDGSRGASYRGVGVDAQVAVTNAPDGRLLPGDWSWRSVEDVVAYAVMCDCAVPGSYGQSTSTVLTKWERVRRQADEDLDLWGRLYVPAGEDASNVSDRPEVESAMRMHWRRHLAPEVTTRDLEAAWARSQRALAEVDEAVFAMRRAGLAWADVGRAIGMARQSARERWGARFAAVEEQAHAAACAALGVDDDADSWDRAEEERWRQDER